MTNQSTQKLNIITFMKEDVLQDSLPNNYDNYVDLYKCSSPFIHFLIFAPESIIDSELHCFYWQNEEFVLMAFSSK